MADWEQDDMFGPGGGWAIDPLGNRIPDPFGALAPTAPVEAPQPAAPEPVQQAPVVSPIMDPTTGLPSNIQLPAVAPNVQTRAQTAPAAGIPQAVPPDMRPGQANAAPQPTAPPDMRPGQANVPATIQVSKTDTTTTNGTSTQGISEASKQQLRGATDQANAAAAGMGNVEAGNINAQADLQRTQAQQSYARGVNDYYQQWGQLQTQEQIAQETDRRLQEAAKFKPDRTQLFGGDSGVAFGISAAIAAMAGGWLMGQGLTGGKNPYLDIITRMIDDNANDQIRQNSQTMDQLTRILGDSKAAVSALKAKMRESVNETITAQTKFQDADLVQRGAATVMARVEAEKAKNDMEYAKATADTVTKQHQVTSQRTSQTVPNPAFAGGLDVNDAKTIQTIQKAGALEDLVNEAISLEKSGDLAANTGLLDEAAGSIKRGLRMRDPGQKRVEDFKAQLQLINRADWASEPNGQEIQRQLSSIGIPENDAEIPIAVERLRAVLNQVDPGGRFRMARRALGNRTNANQTGPAIPIVK